ncbi:MAG: DUF6350 family protein [Propionibacteriaceae bacterium]|nr:DUF6350 family protein [Propionibacteriaceae bacterium]
MAGKNSLGTRTRVETFEPHEVRPQRPTMPWWLAAIGGSVLCAVAGWAIVAAIVVGSVLPYREIDVGATVPIATGFWLLAHGGIFQFGGLTITLVPLVLTALVAFLIHGVGSYATKQASFAVGSASQATAILAKVVALIAGTYTVIVVGTVLMIDGGGPGLRAGFYAALLAGFSAWLGGRRSVRSFGSDRWPVWVRAIPRAVSAGVIVAVLGGIVVLVSALVSHRDQYVFLSDQLNPGWSGVVLLTIIQFCYCLNFAVWGTSWAYGPGFMVGDESIVSLAGSHVGMLPGFPITAALPTDPSPGSWAWLIVPCAAGIVSAAVILKARPQARMDETGLVGGLSGVLSGLALVVLATMTRGSLGVERLADLGPVLTPLWVIAPSLMGLSGMFTGLIVGLFSHPRGATDYRWWARRGSELEVVPAVHGQGHIRHQETSTGRSETPGVESRPASSERPIDPAPKKSENPTKDEPEEHEEAEVKQTPILETIREVSLRARLGWLAPVFQKSTRRTTPEEPTSTTPPQPPQGPIIGEQLPLDFHGEVE